MNLMYPAEMEWALVGIIASGHTIPDKEALQTLRKEDFGDEQAGCVFGVEMGLMARRMPPKMGDIAVELARVYGDKRGDKVMGIVIEAVKRFGLNGHAVKTYVNAVAEGARRRALDRLGTELKQAAGDAGSDIDKTADLARVSLRESVRETGTWISGAEAGMLAIEAAEANVKPIRTGFRELDSTLCGGLMKPELTIVGARPGKGKSAFLLAVAMNAARAGVHTCYISLEMSAVQLGQRALAAASNVSVSKQRAGGEMLTESDWKALADGVCELDQRGAREYLHLYPTYGMTVERLTGIAQNAMDRGELELLVVDYIQLLQTEQKTRSDFERIGVVSKALKALALMLDIPILTAAQVRRQDSQGKALRAPGLDELRGSGDLEQDADNVLLIHAPETPDDATLKSLPGNHEGIFQRAQMLNAQAFSVEVAKQRQGANRRTWCLFRPMTMQFEPDQV